MENTMKCCICGQESEYVEEYVSTLTNKPTPYCIGCIRSGFECYDDLLDYGWEYHMFNETYRNKILNPTLKLHRKSIEQFNEDVKKRDEINVTL